jgi:hypothetical protein
LKVVLEAPAEAAAMAQAAELLVSGNFGSTHFFFGPYGSSMTEIVANITERHGRVLLAGASSSTSVYEVIFD